METPDSIPAGNTDLQELERTAAELQEKFHGHEAELNTARAAFEATTVEMHSVEKHQQAAEAEAANAREAWRGLLRDSNGVITKEIHKARAGERSAYTLVEEYGEFLGELKRQHTAQELEVAEKFLPYAATGEKLRDMIAEIAFQKAMADYAATLAVVQRLMEIADPSENAMDHFFHRLKNAMKLHAEHATQETEACIAATRLDRHLVNHTLVNSQIERQRRLKEMAR